MGIINYIVNLYTTDSIVCNKHYDSYCTNMFTVRSMHFVYQADLKAVDTIGNCQILAFTVGVSQHKHKITNL